MLSPEQFVEDFLAHAGMYDPQKAHEYYIRNRKLKGRPSGTSDTQIGKSAPPAGVGKAASARGPVVGKSAAQLSAEAQARISAIQGRIAKLQTVLSDLVREAGAASSSSSSSSSSKTSDSKSSDTKSTSTDTKSSDRKPLTEKQKQDARARSADYYDEHKKSSDSRTTEQKIADVREQIAKSRAELKAAIARSRPRVSQATPA